MYFIWKLHAWVSYKVFSSPAHKIIPTMFPFVETVLAQIFCNVPRLLWRISLIRNCFNSSFSQLSFEFVEIRKSRKEQGQVSKGVWGRTEEQEHFQFIGQNLVTKSNWYPLFFLKLPNSQTSICPRQNVDCWPSIDLEGRPGCYSFSMDCRLSLKCYATWNMSYVS